MMDDLGAVSSGLRAQGSRLTAHGSIDSLLRESVAHRPDRPALHLWGQDMSYRDLSAAVDRLADHLLATSNGYTAGRSLAGARIGIIAPNVPALIIAMFAVWRSGAAVVPLNARLREFELGRILHDAGVSVLIAVSAYRGYSFVSLMPRLLPQLPGLRSCLFVDPMGEIEDQIEQPAAAPEAALDAQFGAILYTSGTTGMPKGALVKHERELGGAHQMGTVLGLTPEDTCIFVVPITHAFLSLIHI